MFFDTHAHYDDERFDPDREDLMASLPDRGVDLVVNPGCDRLTSEKSLAFAEKYPYFYSAVGWHPHEAPSFGPESADLIRRWAGDSKVVAIGEIGLDYFYDADFKDKQKEVFSLQLSLAEELDLPVIIHDREAHGDCMDILRAFPKVRGEFHCFSGSLEMARELVDRGWYLGFNGSITFKNARRAPEVIAWCPGDRILIETDSPYLTPVPHRGERNDSTMLPYIAGRIAEIRGISPDRVAADTMENGKRFFSINEETKDGGN